MTVSQYGRWTAALAALHGGWSLQFSPSYYYIFFYISDSLLLHFLTSYSHIYTLTLNSSVIWHALYTYSDLKLILCPTLQYIPTGRLLAV